LGSLNWTVIKSKLPFNGHQLDPNRIMMIWKKVDKANNGFASLRDIEIALSELGPEMDPVCRSKVALNNAFNKANTYSDSKDEFIKKRELKFFFIYLF